MKLLEENIGGKLQDVGFSNYFLDMTPNVKINKWDCTKLKNFCAKETINRVRKQCMEQEKIFVNHVYGKGLISRIYKELLQFNNKKMNNPIKNGKRT